MFRISQIRISKNKALYEKSARLPNESAHLLLGCDAVVSVSPSITRTFNPNITKAIINGRVEPIGVAGVHTGTTVDDQLLKKHLENHLDTNNLEFLDMSMLAEKLVGDTVSANIMMLGYASQKHVLPLSVSALEKAIELNGVSVEQNLKAFNWGRLLADKKITVFKIAGLIKNEKSKIDINDIKDKILKFRKILTEYQDNNLANQYESLIKKLYIKEKKLFGDRKNFELSRKASLMLFRFMRYKDEYEVARLHTQTSFSKNFLNNNKSFKIEFYLAPPIFSLKDKSTGYPKKIKFGPWIIPLFKILSKFKFVRGSKFDFFGKTLERKKERELAEKAKLSIKCITENLFENNYKICEDLIDTSLKINGFGHVKDKKIAQYENVWEKLLLKITEIKIKKVS